MKLTNSTWTLTIMVLLGFMATSCKSGSEGGGGVAPAPTSGPVPAPAPADEELEAEVPALSITPDFEQATAFNNGLVFATASMAMNRQSPAAVLLDDGKVLVTGGKFSSALFGTHYYAHSEIYSPGNENEFESGSFRAAAHPMNSARMNHSMVKLNNGDVLVVGGTTGHGQIGSAEYFDSVNETWTSIEGECATTLSGALTVTLLQDGRVLALGGHSKNADIYDPNDGAFGCFAPTGELSISRGYANAVLLDDGRVLVVGGYSGLVAEIYDPTTEMFSNVADPLDTSRHGSTVTKVLTGKVLISGGDSVGNYTQSALLFDPSTDTFSATGSPAFGRAYANAQLLTAGPQAGNVVLVGGFENGGSSDGTKRIEVYNPTTESFIETATQSKYYRAYFAMVVLADGARVLNLGGYRTGVNMTEIFSTKIAGSNYFHIEGGTAPYTLSVTQGDARVSAANGAQVMLDSEVGSQSITVQVTDADGTVANSEFEVVAE